jgi:hypothetical protein
MQRLLATADWDVDAVRDDVRDYVVEHLALVSTEPNLARSYESRAAHVVTVRCWVSLEALPPWHKDADVFSEFVDYPVRA